MEADRGSSGLFVSRPFSAEVGVPLFHAAWLFALGIAIAHWVWLRPGYLLIALAPFAVLCAISAFRAQRVRWFALGALFCMLGAWCAEMEPQPAPNPQIASLSDGLIRTVEGTITAAGPVRGEVEQNAEEPNGSSITQRIDVRVTSVEFVDDYHDSQAPASGASRLTVRWMDNSNPAVAFHCGDRIRADARLMRPQCQKTWLYRPNFSLQ